MKKKSRKGAPGQKSHPESPRPAAIISQLKREPNELRRKMLLVGYLSNKLSKKGKSIFLVGGQAVETYTAGQFTTGDIDITTTDKEATEKLLVQMGFTREGIVWLSTGLGVAVHIVGDYPTRSEKVRKIDVGPYTVYVTGVEDLIVDRFKAAKSWKSERDREQGVVLFNVFRGSIDAEYLRRRAREESVEDVLPE